MYFFPASSAILSAPAHGSDGLRWFVDSDARKRKLTASRHPAACRAPAPGETPAPGDRVD